jgi:hypothetical protein
MLGPERHWNFSQPVQREFLLAGDGLHACGSKCVLDRHCGFRLFDAHGSERLVDICRLYAVRLIRVQWEQCLYSRERDIRHGLANDNHNCADELRRAALHGDNHMRAMFLAYAVDLRD